MSLSYNFWITVLITHNYESILAVHNHNQEACSCFSPNFELRKSGRFFILGVFVAKSCKKCPY
jgi:hypothetical protein